MGASQNTAPQEQAVAQNERVIVDVGAVADDGNDENLLTMVQTVKEYGVY